MVRHVHESHQQAVHARYGCVEAMQWNISPCPGGERLHSEHLPFVCCSCVQAPKFNMVEFEDLKFVSPVHGSTDSTACTFLA